MNKKWGVLASVLTGSLLLSACGAILQNPQTLLYSSDASDKPLTVATTSHSWSYDEETGPDHWAELEEDYAICSTGEQQSPINIDHTKLVSSDEIKPVELHYNNLTASVLNNGHTIQVNTVQKDNYMMLDGEKYTLQQFHFHHPSEHQIDGKNADMELHLVHTNTAGEYAVASVLIHSGEANPAFDQLWTSVDKDADEEAVELKKPLQLTSLIPNNLKSVHYNGSLTTPPCTENVSWSVIEEPIELSQQQIERFATLFPDNHRSVQPIGSRTLYMD